MSIHQAGFVVQTAKRSIIVLTEQITTIVAQAGIITGLCNVFMPHTSASLIFCENADPDVRRDLEAFMGRLVPDGDNLFRHTAEGPDDMPAHVRTVLTQNSLMIPIGRGELMLGTWQGIYLWEHRTQAHRRQIIVSIIGDT